MATRSAYFSAPCAIVVLLLVASANRGFAEEGDMAVAATNSHLCLCCCFTRNDDQRHSMRHSDVLPCLPAPQQMPCPLPSPRLPPSRLKQQLWLQRTWQTVSSRTAACASLQTIQPCLRARSCSLIVIFTWHAAEVPAKLCKMLEYSLSALVPQSFHAQ